MEYIDLTEIHKAFPELNCEWVESIESTQKSVKANSLLIAEEQTAGVGRRGNNWLTPKGKSICLSYRFTLPLAAKEFSGYQLTSALALFKTIQFYQSNTTIKLKWPNDLFFDDAKLAGILINLIPTAKSQTEIIVGIGLNWRLSKQQLSSVNRPICNAPISELPQRETFIIRLIQTINKHNEYFIHYGLDYFLNTWHENDYLKDKTIILNGENLSKTGVYAGINPSGEILINTSAGIKHFSSGEVSVKPV